MRVTRARSLLPTVLQRISHYSDMKLKLTSFIFPVLAGAFVAAGVSGCSLLEKSGVVKQNGSEGTVTEVPAESTSTIKPLVPPSKSRKASSVSADKSRKNTKGVKNSKKTNKQKAEAVKEHQQILKTTGEDPTRRESVDQAVIPSPKGNATHQHEPLLQTPDVPVDFSINGEWTIFKVRNNLVGGEERPYVNFDLAAKRFYGSNGCNYINGDLRLEGRFQITLENMITSMKMCQDAEYEYLINLALSDVRSFAVRPDGSETYLDMKSENGTTILVLRRHNMDFLNGAWLITELNGTELKGEDDATITINIPDLKIHGSTGCNIFNGKLFIDPDKRRSMQFAEITTTRMACPDPNREMELLLALEEVEHARLNGKDTVEMYGKDGDVLIVLTRLHITQENQ